MVAEKTHADLDQDGKMINPHNPDFITKVPWYLGSSGPTLKHHNIQKADHFLSITESDELIARKNELKKKSSSKVSSCFGQLHNHMCWSSPLQLEFSFIVSIQNKHYNVIATQKQGVFRKGACKNCGAMTHKEKVRSLCMIRDSIPVYKSSVPCFFWFACMLKTGSLL